MSLIRLDPEKVAALTPTADVPGVPQEVSKAQGVAVLVKRELWLPIKDYFDNQAEELERETFKAITVFNRQSPLMAALKPQFGLTDEDLDQLFLEASAVVI